MQTTRLTTTRGRGGARVLDVGALRRMVRLTTASFVACLLVVVPVPVPAGAASSVGTFFPLPPARILDTRSGVGAVVGPVGPGATLGFVVTGRGGVPAGDVSAVVLNVTVVGPSAGSYMTVWPSGEVMPTASNLNYSPGQTVPNLVKVKVGVGGQVSVFNAAGSVHVLADVAGWYRAGADPVEGARYNAVSPSRVLDTRTGVGGPVGTVGPGGSVVLQVAGRGGVPVSGVSAVVVNVTAVNPTAESYLTVWPTGEVRPTASNLNYRVNAVVPNLVIVKVGAGGRISLYNDAGQTNVIADVVGWFGTPPPSSFVNRSLSVTTEHPHMFVPPQVAAPAGSQVTVSFTNPTDEVHTFTSPAVGVDRAVDPFETITFSFTMPFSNTGFVCLVHQSEGMVGTLVPSP